MKIGEKNKNYQELQEITGVPSTPHPLAKIWVMQCGRCREKYASNSCDAHILCCPVCQLGAKGEPLPK